MRISVADMTRIYENLDVHFEKWLGESDADPWIPAMVETEGIIKNEGEEAQIELMVGKEQKTLSFQIWIDKPDVMSISIVSPSGEIVERIPAKDERKEEFKFVYEQTLIQGCC